MKQAPKPWARVVIYAHGVFKVFMEGMVEYTLQEAHLVINWKF